MFAPVDQKIRDAQCEQVLFILKNTNAESLYNYKALGADEVQIGDTRVRFKKGANAVVPISPEARKLMSRWFRKSMRVGRA